MVNLSQNIFENTKKEFMSFILALVLLLKSFDHLPSYQTPFAKGLQVTDRKRERPLVSMPYYFITFCELLLLSDQVNLCSYFILVC